MLTWSESVKKEKAAIKIYENFTINPKNSILNYLYIPIKN